MAKDLYHDAVKEALEKEGWTITHDPYFLRLGVRKGYIDLGAERILIGAEKENEKIAVEVKSFIGKSDIDDFKEALGQFLIYLLALEDKGSTRVLYLAIPFDFYDRFFQDTFFARLTSLYRVNLLLYDKSENTIKQWILK
jgi:hypothetical protein